MTKFLYPYMKLTDEVYMKYLENNKYHIEKTYGRRFVGNLHFKGVIFLPIAGFIVPASVTHLFIPLIGESVEPDYPYLCCVVIILICILSSIIQNKLMKLVSEKYGFCVLVLTQLVIFSLIGLTIHLFNIF